MRHSGIQALVAVGLLSLLAPQMTTPASSACTHYAAPGLGPGHAGTLADPFRIVDFWTVRGGPQSKVLCLTGTNMATDGHYTGANNMIAPVSQATAGLSGTANARITIRALNDGGVLIDGEGARAPFSSGKNNAYFTIEGINFCCGRGAVISFYSSSVGSQHMIFRRSVAWNAGGSGVVGANAHVWDVAYSTDVLLEDVAGFGTGRNVFLHFRTTDVLLRRVWARWEGYDANTGPKVAIQLEYFTTNGRCENCLATWTAEQMPNCKNLGVDPGIFKNPNNVRGSIAYMKASARCNPEAGVLASEDSGQAYVLTDVASYTPFGGVRPFALYNPAAGTATRLTGIKGTKRSHTGSWTVRPTLTEPAWVAGLPDSPAPNIYMNPNQANICKRYVNGALTNDKLWPWPMDDRIRAAVAQSGSSALAGSAGSGYDTGTITSEIISLFGTIPRQCFD